MTSYTDTPESTERLLYRIDPAAEMIGVSRSTVYELMDAGLLESVRIGRARRIPAEALRDYVNRLRAAGAEPSA